MNSSGRKLRIAVLAGGTSAERAVSLESGRCVTEALRSLGHHVLEADPAATPLSRSFLSDCDIVLPMVHGTGGEDGQLQQQLQHLQLPYVGSSPQAAALTFDKLATRECLQQAGVPVAEGRGLAQTASLQDIQNVIGELEYPVVVKPHAQGSSVGVSIVTSAAHLMPALHLAWTYCTMALVERYIAGREVTVPVIDGVLFPPVEILPAVAWYDYSAKYEDHGTRYNVDPVDLPESVRQVSELACRVCEVKGICRVDLRVTADGHPFVLEVNTIPGMTSHSLVPMSAAAAGLSLGQLCEQVCRRELARWSMSS